MKKTNKIFSLEIFIALFLFSAAFTACKNRTKLTMETQDASAAKDGFESLLKIMDIPYKSITSEANKITVVFHSVISPDKRKALEKTLKRLIRITPKTPSFTLEITETDPEVIKVLGLTPETQKKLPVEMDLTKGARELLQDPNDSLFDSAGASRTQNMLCVWAFPLKSKLPTLTYQQSLEMNGSESGENETLRNLQNTLNATFAKMAFTATAEHKVTSDDAAFDKWAESMHFGVEDHVYFEFGTQTGVTNFFYGRGTASESEFKECVQSIFEKGDDLFFGSLMFPTLAKNLKSYRFEESVF